MAAASAKADEKLNVQEHCIDLPGETVQCWVGGGTDKLKVILRKHRDVVFDIHLGSGKTYTLETTQSDFYSVRDKKLIYAARHGKIEFKDGERIHVWVSRGFRGALIVKCEGHILSEVKPNEWDPHQHGQDPKEKPAPIIVALANAAPSTGSKTAPPSVTDTGLHQDEQSVHIHEATKEHAPPAILKFFEDGGESLHLDSENIITQNWIMAQLAGGAGYVADNHKWITELRKCKFTLQTIKHKTGPKVYMVFSGNNKIREYMSASKYGFKHPKVMRITGGAGGTKQAWDATKGAAKDSLKVFAKEEGKMVLKGGGIAVFFAIALDTAEWYKDYSEVGADGKPKKDFTDLFAKVSTDLVKASLVAALTTASISILFSFAAGAGATVAAPVLLVVVGTIIVSSAITYFVEKGDRMIGRALGKEDTTTWLAEKFRQIAAHLYQTNKDGRYEYYAAIPL